MSVDAIALLKLPADSVRACFPPESRVDRLRELDDAVLLYTLQRFATPPDDLATWLRRALGDVLDQHLDPRGVYLIPDVAEPRARGYDALIAEVGAGGFWAPKVAAGHVPERMANAPAGSLEATTLELMRALGPELQRDLERAMAAGDFATVARLNVQIEAALAKNPELTRKFEAAIAGSIADPLKP